MGRPAGARHPAQRLRDRGALLRRQKVLPGDWVTTDAGKVLKPRQDKLVCALKTYGTKCQLPTMRTPGSRRETARAARGYGSSVDNSSGYRNGVRPTAPKNKGWDGKIKLRQQKACGFRSRTSHPPSAHQSANSSNIVVLRYFSARSGKPPRYCPVRCAARCAWPPASRRRCHAGEDRLLAMISRAMAIASSLSTISCMSICEGS